MKRIIYNIPVSPSAEIWLAVHMLLGQTQEIFHILETMTLFFHHMRSDTQRSQTGLVHMRSEKQIYVHCLIYDIQMHRIQPSLHDTLS